MFVCILLVVLIYNTWVFKWWSALFIYLLILKDTVVCVLNANETQNIHTAHYWFDTRLPSSHVKVFFFLIEVLIEELFQVIYWNAPLLIWKV